jgi:hypothetical protein
MKIETFALKNKGSYAILVMAASCQRFFGKSFSRRVKTGVSSSYPGLGDCPNSCDRHLCVDAGIEVEFCSIPPPLLTEGVFLAGMEGKGLSAKLLLVDIGERLKR